MSLIGFQPRAAEKIQQPRLPPPSLPADNWTRISRPQGPGVRVCETFPGDSDVPAGRVAHQGERSDREGGGH